MPAIERTDHLVELICEAIDADGHRCPECADTAPGDKLLVFSTVRGARVRQHDGAFCSKLCHDRWHRLKPRQL
jgi:hypothetical protein